MIWLTWRQFRTQLLIAVGLAAAACVVLAVTGPRLADLASRDVSIYDLLTSNDRLLFYGGVLLLAVAPPLIGVFWGAPLVARELETGTFRLVWNQSVTRSRWLAVKLGLSVLATVVVVGALSLAITWWAHPLDGVTGAQHGSLPLRLTPVSFAMRGLVPVGYAVFALLLGTLLGLVLRRSLPAMALTLAVYVCVQVAVPLWVRPHLVPATTSYTVISESNLDGILSDGSGTWRISVQAKGPGDWVLSNQTVDADGDVAALPSAVTDCLPQPPSEHESGTARVEPAPGTLDTCLGKLADAGYRQRLVYQPRTHFWPLQYAETGLYLVASAGLAALTFWQIRRRRT
ncbi:ABC transporter permease subunit [Nocardioides conyzicola]|uniref:Transporter n=1 Tax=Nocardioides conyzicola TaxID=1651781 RepID=A0ABP8X0R3_9ACTN